MEGVRPDPEMSPWNVGWPLRTTRLVGLKVQAIGRWGFTPKNANYEGYDDGTADPVEDALDDALLASIDADGIGHEASIDEAAAGGNNELSVDVDPDSEDDSNSDESQDDYYGGRDRLRCAEACAKLLDPTMID